MDPWLRELAKVNREKQDAERNRLDERWDRLSSGDLSPEEEAELRALAETSEEAREAYEAFRPLGPDFHARVARAIREQGLAAPAAGTGERPAKPLPFRGRAARWAGWGSLAAAAAALLVTALIPPAPVSEYAAPEVSGVSSFRGEPSATELPVVEPGRPFEVTVSPETRADDVEDLQAFCFLSRGQELGSLQVLKTLWDPGGAVKIETVTARDVGPGTWTLWVVLGREGEMPDMDHLRRLLTTDRVRQRDWVAVSRKVRIQSGGLPP
ncbi:MAG TPA: hypothetical protein VF789_19080 [Thermoanaerobaculia bacterium]